MWSLPAMPLIVAMQCERRASGPGRSRCARFCRGVVISGLRSSRFLRMPARRDWSFMPLVRIGSYAIIHPLGESKDALYLARDYELDLQVILQLLPIDDYGDEQRERLRRRMREAARLQHPHIARILDFGTEGAFAYVAMEYAAGEPLPDAVRRLGRL